MAQHRPEDNTTLDQVIKMADRLTPEEQEQLVEQIKLKWLRRAMDEADESLAQGRSVSLEELDKHIDSAKRKIIEERQK
ncbi:MAG: hypothetical protein KC777_28800 [Cyanobacteria bacterium HKST-UBA02]|nr:hypothetical protein [Cyanobacteria bacterium HKST-UBA02]